MDEGKNVLPRHELIANRLPKAFLTEGLETTQFRPLIGSTTPLGLQLCLEWCPFGIEGISVGIVRAKGIGHGVHFIGRVALAVHTHVQLEVERVLVYLGIQLGHNHRSILGRLCGVNAGGVDYGCELYLQLYSPVLVEVPKKPYS